MSFADYHRNKQANQNSITEGKTQIKMAELAQICSVVTITDFSFGKSKETGEDYCICLCKELPDKYFFASSVLREDLAQFIADEFDNSIAKAKGLLIAEGGWPYSLKLLKSKNGRDYYSWTAII